MRVIYVIATLLLSLTLCPAQNTNNPNRAQDDAYTQQLVRLLTGLQKNGWSGWKTGTVVVRRYLGNNDEKVKPFTYAQPDLVFEIVEADRRVAMTQVVKSKPHREESTIKAQTASDVSQFELQDVTAASLEVDGFTLSCLLREYPAMIVNDGPSSPGSKVWRLASHPTVVLREDSGRRTWEVASVRVVKKIGGREFKCVKTIAKSTIPGPIEVITTQYLSPDVPGHLIEQVEEFYKVNKEGKERVLYMVVHQQVVEVRIP
jgi:hypothetical protein